MSNVLIKTTTWSLYNAQRVPYAGAQLKRGNLQQDNRMNLPDILQGSGKDLDMTAYFRLRIDSLPNRQTPIDGDLIFISACKNMPASTGWYSVWGVPSRSHGSFASMLVYLHQEPFGV